MAFATLSVENRLEQGLLQLGCPQASFAKICEIPATVISLALRGHTAFTPDRSAQVLEVLQEIRELVSAGGGLPVSFANPTTIRNLLNERRRLQNGQVRETFYSVRINSRSWFVSTDDRTGVVSSISKLFAAGMTKTVAHELLAALKPFFPDAQIFPNDMKHADNSSTMFESLWRLPPARFETEETA